MARSTPAGIQRQQHRAEPLRQERQDQADEGLGGGGRGKAEEHRCGEYRDEDPETGAEAMAAGGTGWRPACESGPGAP